MALTHAQIWSAIDALARSRHMSASGLAKAAGLDPTSFNKSKRISGDTPPRPRWPSTESVAKVLAATGASFAEFAQLAEPAEQRGRAVPLIGLAQAGAQGFFDDAGYPAGSGWDELQFPHVGDPHAYALEITGDSMEPVYRDGDIVVVSPSASLRRGDRVVVKTTGGEVMAKQLLRSTANRIELQSINPAHPLRTLTPGEIVWMARIVWASQ